MIHTRENMSPELRGELELIERGERTLAAKSEIDDAIDAHVFYIASSYGPGRYNQEVNPFEVRVVWDADSGPATLIRIDMRTEILEKLFSICETSELYFKASKAMRSFADELETIGASLDLDSKAAL